MYRIGALLLVILTIITKIVAHDLDAEVYDLPRKSDDRDFPPPEEEYIRHVYSLINAYRSDMLGGRLVIETNALIDTKYKTLKRSADVINSLLSLPKGLNEAGR